MRVHVLCAGLVMAGFLAAPSAAAEPIQVAMLPIVVHAAGSETGRIINAQKIMNDELFHRAIDHELDRK